MGKRNTIQGNTIQSNPPILYSAVGTDEKTAVLKKNSTGLGVTYGPVAVHKCRKTNYFSKNYVADKGSCMMFETV